MGLTIWQAEQTLGMLQLELLSNHLEQHMAGTAKTWYHSKLEPMPYISFEHLL
jgi:hypothetical protein